MTPNCHHPFLLRLLPLLTLLTLSAADDSAVMSKLLRSLSRAPSDWSTSTPFCNWSHVVCDSSSTSVVSINLNSAAVSGSLPPDLDQLSNLQSIDVQINSFSGTLPSFANMTSLELLLLDNNGFTSVPDNFLLGLTNLQTLTMSENHNLSSWRIPNYLTESTNLATFHAVHAGLTGNIPDIFGSFPNLQNLRLSYNNLTGSLPGSFAGSEIQILWLNNQGLSGGIEVLAKMTQLSQVWLHVNAFSGVIPDLSKCTALFDLQLKDNSFTGVVPTSLMNLPTLVNITLQNNKLQGPFPNFPSKVEATMGNTNSFCLDKPGPCDPQVTTLLNIAAALGYPIRLAESWQGNNACQNWRFINCDPQGRNVTVVNMGKQGFSGTISPDFAHLFSLRNLVLNDNDLTGIIPIALTNLPQLRNFDVSNNNLSGPIPDFPSTVKFTYSGNLLLGRNESGGGGPGTRPGTGPGTRPVTRPPGTGPPGTRPPGTGPGSHDGSPSGSSNRHSSGIIFGVVTAAVLFIGVMLFVSYRCYVKRKKKSSEPIEGQNEIVEPSGTDGNDGVPSELHRQSDTHVFEGGNISVSIEVLRQATNDFSDVNVLGRGGFGVVYRGKLQDGTMVAVKRMNSLSMGRKGLGEFEAEINVLTKVRHRHLVALLGYCINGNERLLVYEYMPQGTLAQHLFERRARGYQPLTWMERVTIALDVARGVEYLHGLAQDTFIHRDLNPKNILLSDDMRAKVADFGLVKKAPDGMHSVQTRVAGTFGYIAPEYAASGRVTKKADVYAFGAILMEMITGTKAVDNTLPEDRSHLVPWFRKVLKDGVDLRSSLDRSLDLVEENYDSIRKVAQLAGHCTTREHTRRPDMGHAVNVLGPLVEHWKPPSPQEEDGDGIDLRERLREAVARWQANEGTSRIVDDSAGPSTSA